MKRTAGFSDPIRWLHQEADGEAQLHEEQLVSDLPLASLKMHFDPFLRLKNQTCMFLCAVWISVYAPK